MSCAKIGRQFGVGYQVVVRALRRRGISIRQGSSAIRRCTLNENVFDILTNESAYWLGVLMADGSVMTHPAILQYGTAEIDATHVWKFRAFLGSSHAVTVRAPKLLGTYTTQPFHALCIRSVSLVNAVQSFGITPRKSRLARASVSLINNRDFWRGVVDGDGFMGAYRDKRRPHPVPCVGLCGSRSLVSQFATFVRANVPHCTSRIQRVHSIYKFVAYGKYALTILRILYEGAHTALDRKRGLATQIMAGYATHG